MVTSIHHRQHYHLHPSSFFLVYFPFVSPRSSQSSEETVLIYIYKYKYRYTSDIITSLFLMTHSTSLRINNFIHHSSSFIITHHPPSSYFLFHPLLIYSCSSFGPHCRLVQIEGILDVLFHSSRFGC